MAAKGNADDDVIADINVVPLVDIILVVLIIFMVTAPTVMKSTLPLDLPAASSSDPRGSTPFEVAVTEDGRTYIRGREVGESEIRDLARAAAETDSNLEAIVAADAHVDYGVVIKVMDWLKASGVAKLAVTTGGEGNEEASW